MDLFGRNQSSVIQNQGTPDPRQVPLSQSPHLVHLRLHRRFSRWTSKRLHMEQRNVYVSYRSHTQEQTIVTIVNLQHSVHCHWVYLVYSGLPQGPKTCVAQKLLKLYCLEFTSHNCTDELPEWRILDMGYQSKPGMDISGLEGLFDRDIPKIILALCQRVNITKPKSSMEWLSCELPKKARSIQRDDVFPSPPAFFSLRLSTWKWSMCPSSHKIWYCWGKGLW